MTFCMSGSLRPFAGIGRSAEPPPDSKQMTRSEAIGLPTSSSIILTPSTPSGPGIGWVARCSSMREHRGSGGRLSGMLTIPAVTLSPSTFASPAAIPPAALPPPITIIRSNLESWNALGQARRVDPSTVSVRFRIVSGSAALNAAVRASRMSEVSRKSLGQFSIRIVGLRMILLIGGHPC